MADKAVTKKKIEKSQEIMTKTESKNAVKAEKSSDLKPATLKVEIIGIDGSSKGSMVLSEAVFGTKPNQSLIAQAVRVYLANQRQGNASTKTRGEVVGSTRKIYRQKGTGRARHGALKAPIFVGGGVAHGPKPHDFSMSLPSKMKKKALISALSEKAQMGSIKILDGEFSGKTKEFVNILKKMEIGNKGSKNALFVVDENNLAVRAAHNIKGLEIERANTVNTYGVKVNKNIIFTKNAVELVTKRLEA